jgi:hypothetical protein
LLAVALLVAPLLETAHEARVSHVPCPEDGELIDVPAQARHDHAPQEAGIGAQLFRERDPAAPTGTGSDHEHCIIALRGHLRARAEKPPQLSTPYEVAAVSTAVASLPVPLRSIALYRLAPKSGPPQA